MIDFERDINKVKCGEDTSDLTYRTIAGFTKDLVPLKIPSILKNSENESFGVENCEDSFSESGSSCNSDKNEDCNDDKSKFINAARPRDESPESKKV